MKPLIVKPTLLIIDDTPSNLSVVVRLFEDCGYRIVIAQDGEEGVQRAQRVLPDLILLDVMMPGKDGFETCRCLKALVETRDIPVIFMTALASAEHKVKGFQAGAVDYVTKPLQIDEVLARVETHLALSAAQKKLAEHNGELERRVEARTAELTAREREFRTLAENLPDNLSRLDKQGRVVYMNQRLLGLLGRSLEEMVGRTPLELRPGAFYEEYQACLMETIRTGQAREMELVFPDRGEGVRYHYIRFVAERDGLGEIVGALTIGRDITESKQAERELLLLNAAVNASSEAAFLQNASGRFVYVNEEACRSLGYSREALLGMCPLDINPDLTPEFYGKLQDEIFTIGPKYNPMESRHRSKDGRIFPIELSASPIIMEGAHYCLSLVRDISARKHAERLLHEQQQAISAVVVNSPDAISRYDRQLRRTYVNPATERLLGLPAAAIIGKSIAQLPSAPEAFAPMLESVFTSGKELHVELPFHWSNGEKGWGDARLVPEFGADGQVASVLAIGRDITVRKHMEEALREERGLFVGGPTVVFKWKAQDGWPVEYVSPNIAEQFGYAPEDLTGGKIIFSSIIHPDELARVAAEVADYSARGLVSYEQVYRIAHADGRYRWIYDFTIVVRNGEGAITHYHGYVMDITAQKMAEEALREREQRYREIFDNAVEGIYLLEVTEDGRFRNLDINPALVASTGIPREAMIGRYVDETVDAETGRAIVEKYRRCLAAASTIQESIELDLPSGKRFYDSIITPIEFGGRIHRLIGISRDITELKRAEFELKASREQLRGLTAQRERAREEERKYIAREVHDELGQILTGLKLNISVLDHKFAAGSPPLREHLKETLMLTDRALEVARNVAAALRPAALDMGIVSALEWLTGRYGANAGLRCELRIAEGEFPLEERHAIALFRIVQESLTNVTRYANADKVVIDLNKDASDYVLKVRDNGVGFDTGNVKPDSFGLVGIRERALMLGGSIAISSAPGDGTEIAVRIPMKSILEES